MTTSEITITIDIKSLEASIRSIELRSSAGTATYADAMEIGRARALVELYYDARHSAECGYGDAVLCNAAGNSPYSAE